MCLLSHPPSPLFQLCSSVGFSSFSFHAELKREHTSALKFTGIQQWRQTDRQTDRAVFTVCWTGFRYPFFCCSLSLLHNHGESTLRTTSFAFSSWLSICSSGGPSVWPCCADHTVMISKTTADPFFTLSTQSCFRNCWFFLSVIL